MIVDRFTSAKISSNLDERTLAILATDERRVILSNVVTFSVWIAIRTFLLRPRSRTTVYCMLFTNYFTHSIDQILSSKP